MKSLFRCASALVLSGSLALGCTAAAPEDVDVDVRTSDGLTPKMRCAACGLDDPKAPPGSGGGPAPTYDTRPGRNTISLFDFVVRQRCSTCTSQDPPTTVCHMECPWSFIQNLPGQCRDGWHRVCTEVASPVITSACWCYAGGATLADNDRIDMRTEPATDPGTVELVVELTWDIAWKGIRVGPRVREVETPFAGARPNTPYVRSSPIVLRPAELAGNMVVLSKQTTFERTPMYEFAAGELALSIGSRIVLQWNRDR